MPDTHPYDAVLLLQMGGPEDLGAIEPFLRNLFADPDIIRLPRFMRPFQPRLAARIAAKRTPLIRPRYETIGGSPIGAITRAQADGLARRLRVPVHVAMRYCAPTADEAVAAITRSGSRHVLVLSLYPHYSPSTTGSSLRDLAWAIRRARSDADWSVIDRWGEHPAYIDVLASSCQEVAKGHLVLSAHSLPQKYVDAGDLYPTEVEATVTRLKERMAGLVESVQQGYQSAVGPVRWIGPETEAHINAIAQAGAKDLTLAPLGFVSDHIETLYDIDIKYTQQARRQGLRVHRVPSLNDREDFLDALATIGHGPAAPFEVDAWIK